MSRKIKLSDLPLIILPTFLFIWLCLMAIWLIRPIFHRNNAKPFLNEVAKQAAKKFGDTCLSSLPDFDNINLAASEAGMTKEYTSGKETYRYHTVLKRWTQAAAITGDVKPPRNFNGTRRTLYPYRLSINSSKSTLTGYKSISKQCHLYHHNGYQYGEGVRKGSIHPSYLNVIIRHISDELTNMDADFVLLQRPRYPALHQDIIFKVRDGYYYLRASPSTLIVERAAPT